MKHRIAQDEVAPRSDGGDRAFIALGSNVGDRVEHLRFAVARLAGHRALHVSAVSPVYASAAHTVADEAEAPPYLNAVLALQSRLGPRALLSVCLEIERARGRDRSAAARWAPRTLDIDLLLFGEVTLREPDLTLPHPRMAERRFVLLPLANIAPEARVPAPWNASVKDLLEACPDEGEIHPTPHRLDEDLPDA